MLAKTMLCGSKLSGAFCARQKLFSVSPALASKTTASATWVTTNAERARCRAAPPLPPRVPASCSAPESAAVFEIFQAGQMPDRMPAASAIAAVKKSALRSMHVSWKRGTSRGARPMIASRLQMARITPGAAPTNASTALSVSS